MNLCIIQARTSSSRFPKKVLMPLGGETVLQRMVRICQSINGVDKVVVATSTDPSDDAIADLFHDDDKVVFRGDLNNVLLRFHECAKSFDAKNIIRVTADCPFLDPAVAGTLLFRLTHDKLDYCSNVAPPTWPDGLDCEVFTFATLEKVMAQASRPSHFEHVTSYIHEHLSDFKTFNWICPIGNMSDLRWTMDYPEDLEFIRQVVENLDSPTPSYLQVLETIEKGNLKPLTPKTVVRNEGYKDDQGTQSEKLSFKRSKEVLAMAESLIPVGCQTFSKSKYQFPPGHAPLFLSHGRGSHVWDVDGNKYIDLINGLLPVVLGYCDYDVDQAIREQLDRGISFSLATELEWKLAKKLNELIPAAESVRFGKNGSDATTACIRVARAFTGRDRVITCGYHGWHDWYIGTTTRKKGIPEAVSQLSSTVPYNDLEAVEKKLNEHKGEFACMIMEPMNVAFPAPGYLNDLKKLLHDHGTLLVFDEVITGFRFALGGAQSYFGVTPDLSSFGKAMANGMPMSAVVGRKDVMQEMDSIFYSGTFAGEALSLAASLAVIDKMEKQNVIESLWQKGERLAQGVNQALVEFGLQEHFELMGAAPWKIWNTAISKTADPLSVKSFFLLEMINGGVLTLGSHNISFAHSESDLLAIEGQFYKACKKLRHILDNGDLEKELATKIVPIFKVR